MNADASGRRRSLGHEVASSMLIGADRGRSSFQLHELWDYRELLYFLVWRDFKVRYKQTVLGGAWAILQPLTAMVLFSIIFGRLARMPSEGQPYPIYCYTALVPWQLFVDAISKAASSLVGNAHLIKKVYFPRMLMPLSGVMGGLVDFFLAFVVLLGMMLWYGIIPGVRILAIPLLLGLALMTALGTGLWLSALNVKFRDVRHVLPFTLQLWLFATPIVYPATLVPHAWQPLYGINPMVSVVEGFRWALLDSRTAFWSTLPVGVVVAVCLVCSGALYFRRSERGFADIV